MMHLWFVAKSREFGWRSVGPLVAKVRSFARAPRCRDLAQYRPEPAGRTLPSSCLRAGLPACGSPGGRHQFSHGLESRGFGSNKSVSYWSHDWGFCMRAFSLLSLFSLTAFAQDGGVLAPAGEPDVWPLATGCSTAFRTKLVARRWRCRDSGGVGDAHPSHQRSGPSSANSCNTRLSLWPSRFSWPLVAG